jgi:uncharacterized membrane protein
MTETTISGRQSDLVVRVDRFALWLSRHWLLVANLVLGVWVLLPWLAPVLMVAGLSGGARLIYFLYSLQCHQLPERSYFLFGPQLMYPLADINAAWSYTTVLELRQFIGNPVMGYKVAWSDRMVALYTPLFVGGLLFAAGRWWLGRQRATRATLFGSAGQVPAAPWWPIRVRWWLLALAPLFVDGFTHLLSDASRLGFRDSNAWLVALTGNALSPTFYAGDAVGSLNWWLRLATGLLAGVASVGLAYPHLDAAFAGLRRSLEIKLHLFCKEEDRR